MIFTYNHIEASRQEYLALPNAQWQKNYFDETTGGYVATHNLKDKDDTTVPGIKAEADACKILAKLGKHVLRLPENVFSMINEIVVGEKKYREMLKFKKGHEEPRGYPDALFDNQTWDFKKSKHRNTNSVRKLILDGRKADNVVFIIENNTQLRMIKTALTREIGNQSKSNCQNELPNVYYLWGGNLICLWEK